MSLIPLKKMTNKELTTKAKSVVEWSYKMEGEFVIDGADLIKLSEAYLDQCEKLQIAKEALEVCLINAKEQNFPGDEFTGVRDLLRNIELYATQALTQLEDE